MPAAIADVVKTYDGNPFLTDEIASLAGFASSLSYCPIDHYIVTCTDKDSKSRAIKWHKTGTTWALEELTGSSDSDSKCGWFRMTDDSDSALGQQIRGAKTDFEAAPTDYYGEY